MKKFGLLLLSLFLLLTACVPTPEEEAVVQKDQEQMLADAAKTDERMEIVDLYERLGAPKEFKANLSATEGRLKVTVDAKVILPDGELPIIRVEPIAFSRSDALTYADILLPPGSEFVEGVWCDDPTDPGDSKDGPRKLYLKSKGFYAREIEKMRWAIEHWNDGGSNLYDIDDSTPADVEKRINDNLLWQSLAPAKLPRIERSTVDIGQMLATVDDFTFSVVACSINPWDGTTLDIEYRRDYMLNPNVISYQNIPNDIPYRDAEATAKALIEKLPVEDFVLSASWPSTYNDDYFRDIPRRVFVFTRSYGGAMETVTNADQTFEEHNHYRGYEKIYVTVDADGVAGFRYQYPYRVAETVEEKTNLLPFSEIEKIFNRMITVYGNHLMDESFEHIRTEYVITNVRLGLCNIPEKDSEAGLLIPAWDFMGYRHDLVEDDCYMTNELESFLTINAIDGSIINRAG